jgi:hypothetical protein
MFKIATWYNNFQASAVLMIDDLSDSYIEVYDETYKNDWGYCCDTKGGSFDFLQRNLLEKYPYIKITYFVPHLKHNVINENSQYKCKKFALGDRTAYSNFLKELDHKGYEIAHHGSNHGEYIDENIPSTVNNWKHEWELFNDVETGVNITLEGVKRFKDICNIDVVGGKYCGYLTIDNSQEIIDECNFLYWCVKVNLLEGDYREEFFGKNKIISFPTNYLGNSFVRLSYRTGNKKRDKIKNILKYFQPLYNILSYIQLFKLYRKQHIISIQEHSSPSTSSGRVQAPNIITDMKSLNKIFKFLKRFSVWYATCREISMYIYVRENSNLMVKDDELIIEFNNDKNIDGAVISIVNDRSFEIKNSDQVFPSEENNGYHVVNVPVNDGKNTFKIVKN